MSGRVHASFAKSRPLRASSLANVDSTTARFTCRLPTTVTPDPL